MASYLGALWLGLLAGVFIAILILKGAWELLVDMIRQQLLCSYSDSGVSSSDVLEIFSTRHLL